MPTDAMWQLVRFCLSGGTGALVGLTTLYLFTDVLEFWYVGSSVASFLIVSVVVFVLQKYWTFREASADRLPKQTLYTALLVLVNLGLNTLLIYLFVAIFGVQYLIAQFFIYGIIATSNFFLYKFVIFKL